MATPSGLAQASGVIAGLVNFGNTCYANALLQALSSCRSYYDYIQQLQKTFPVPLQIELSHELGRITDWKASLPLSRAIALCLERLQPSYSRKPLLASALEVLHGIGQHDRRLFSGFGEQQDVGEVLDCLVASGRTELDAWRRRYLPTHVSLAIPGLSHSFGGASETPRIVVNTMNGPQSVPPSELHSLSVEQFRSLSGFDGLLSHDLECCACGHVFDTQLNPFTSLMLPIANVRPESYGFGVVDADLRLETCLRDFFSTKRQGPIRCPKCSFHCTVSGETSLDLSHGGFSRNQSVVSSSSSHERSSSEEDINNGHSNARKSSGLGDLLVDVAKPASPMGGVVYRSSASFDRREFQNNSLKPSLSGHETKGGVVKELLAAAKESPFHDIHVQTFVEKLETVDINWVHTDSHVSAKTAIAKTPKVLAISLQRKVFDGSRYHKIEGRVRYPLVLDIAEHLKFNSIHCSKYRLKAVLVHQGNENGGHYLTVRAVTSSDGSSVQWVLASDDKVYLVSESAALGMEASMLFYERVMEEQRPVTAVSSFINLCD